MHFSIFSYIFIAIVSTITAQESDGSEWNPDSFSGDFGDNLGRAIPGPTTCGILGNLSAVICVTETKYRLPDNPTTYSCPYGYVCVDHPYICLQDGIPACRYEKRCGVCLANATNVCLGTKEYAACINGETDYNRKLCPASRPYCTMLYDDYGVLHQECSNIIENTCNLAPTTPPPPSPTPPPSGCLSYGKFMDYSDSTCKTYIYCYHNNGEIAAKKYICEGDLIFNPIKGKCVYPNSYRCEA